MSINTESEYWNERFNVEQFQMRLYYEALTWEHTRPSKTMNPKLYLDGNMWCALYGEDIQSGVCGFGKTPKEAMNDFDTNWGC